MEMGGTRKHSGHAENFAKCGPNRVYVSAENAVKEWLRDTGNPLLFADARQHGFFNRGPRWGAGIDQIEMPSLGDLL